MSFDSDFKIGQIVKSKAGRDKGNIFVVNEILDKRHVTLVDGKMRRLENPKKKKIIHLSPYNTIIEDFVNRKEKGLSINNAFIRKILEPYK